MELRDIEIFLTLAEELHFGRTAARLHVSQARVSQAISRQERHLGAPLFDRANRRRIELTPLGRQLRDDLRPVYTGLHDSLRRARLHAQGFTAVLRVGMIPPNAHDLRRYWETFRARHPRWRLRILHAPVTDPFAGLRRGDVDVLVTWLPVREPDLTVGPLLCTGPRVLAVPTDHPLARHDRVSQEAAADLLHPTVDAPGYWVEGLLPARTRRGRVIERGPVVGNAEEALALVSSGEVAGLFPAHVSRYWKRPDIAYLPVRDLDVVRFAPVWRTEAETDLVRAFARTVRDLGPLEDQEAS
ncbi:LysR family transcriptional regulator [Saccharothrix variisporea]|uniref:LysR family transcriptional regulator n=1 Tax=Saccharothrix variisporea TaxID=543527 RepID=UPI000EB08DB7|nr:LysR family transcriptional regulator [Saccharothrix variisporea]